MRLAKFAVACVSPTVGAVHANRTRVVELARVMAREQVTLAAFPEQVIGGYPPEDLVQWRGFLDGQRRSLDAFAAETADLATGVRPRRGGRRREPSVQLRGGGPPRPRARPGAEGKAPDLQRVLRRPYLLARRPWPGARRRRSPARRFRLQLRLRHAGRGGVRGRVVARWPDAPALVLRRGGRRQRLGLALSDGDRLAPGARCWRRGRATRSPCCSTPTRSAARTAWSTTAAGSCSRTAAW